VIILNTNPLNAIETSLGDLCGSTHPVKTAAYKIKSGLVNKGFVVVPATQVDRLRYLLNGILSVENDLINEYVDESLRLLEGWK
jgi:hypothetical protein